MANNVYAAIALTGGAAGALDTIDGAALADKDIAMVVVQGVGAYFYVLDADSAAAESSPTIIAPGANGGDKRWLLICEVASNGKVLTLSGNTTLNGAASDTVAGPIEVATAAETTTGTAADRCVSPDGLAGSDIFGRKTVELIVYNPGVSLATGDGKAYFVVPNELNGMNLVRVAATVVTAGTTNATTIQIHNLTDAVDMLSTLMNIETTETSTRTSATPGTIDTDHDDVASGDVLRIDIDAISTTAPKGLVVELVFQLP